ncbi:MAG TPA: hypothetical protein PLB96_12715 [Syntrophales bacterium]|nr:hypothetical protein [Syntrophales bacterium]
MSKIVKKSDSKSENGKKKKPANKRNADIIPLSTIHFEAMLSDVAGGGKRRAIDEAQQVMYDAWEAKTKKSRIALAKKALAISPDCADAYVLLAEEGATSVEEALSFYKQGMQAGERAIGKKAFREDVGYFWGLLETRPYMRARAGLAECLRWTGKLDKAVEHYWDMLRLNPNDNQGIRDLLMPCLIEMGRVEDAERLFKQYEEDAMAVWMYSRALLDFCKHGASALSQKSLKQAIEENKHVPDYLLGRKKAPSRLPDHYGFGDEAEAVLYSKWNQGAWRAIPGALEWLAAMP